jgi:hypothetical protein
MSTPSTNKFTHPRHNGRSTRSGAKLLLAHGKFGHWPGVYIKQLRRSGPRDVVNVYIPEYVVGHWWENLLHNQSSLRLKGRLLFEPSVMVTSVPWQLHSSAQRDLTRVVHSPGEIRRGIDPAAAPNGGATRPSGGATRPSGGAARPSRRRAQSASPAPDPVARR